MPKWVFRFLLCALLHAIAFASSADEQVLYNGKIFTGEPDHPYASAVVIKGDNASSHSLCDYP
jgi:hypothetical protein